MLLTSAADSTAMHNKFSQFEYPSLANQSNTALVSRSLEVNLAEVSSTTDILPSPPSKSEHDHSFLRCSVSSFSSPHDQSPPIKSDPEHPHVYTPSVLHSPAFFTPQTMHFYQTPGSCASNTHAQYPAQYTPSSNARYDNMYVHNSSPAFTGVALSSLISPGSDHSGYPAVQRRDAAHLHVQRREAAHLPHFQQREDMSAELAAAGAVAAAAARARVVGVEEEVIHQQRASRRQMHKICEQKRRDGLKTALETLKMTIPGCSILSDQSQQNILLKAYQFVCELLRKQQSNKVVIEELQNIKEKNDILQSEIEYFKEEYKKLSSLPLSSNQSNIKGRRLAS